jgi:hypothetical protein
MLSAVVNACKSFLHHVKETIKKITKPETAVLAAGAVSDVTRSRKDLMVENAILRQQLIQHRAHQGINQRIPAKFNQPRPLLSNQVKGKVIATPIPNGLHHSYAYVAC